ncbi:MAG: HAD family phosphatase [Deltaproteobacteria bacterium]|nr:HAD family phosphatase [Deltaproteobacteria bacterium]MBW2070278.1 HAD family phosphatase [Deltaproteobacteria bacterium]
MPVATLRSLHTILFDLDDTFTSQGKIPSSSFEALWELKESGLRLVVVTGRPAGWCDHIARMWPVDGVIGENGAFYFWFDEKERKLKKRFLDSHSVRAEKRQRLEAIRDEILITVPGCSVASDQRYREADLAIDYCEDVPPLNDRAVRKICHIFASHGATCKVSSIHVNGWFGAYNKLDMARLFIAERLGMDLDETRERFVYCGDSLNDEPMFAYFPISVAVQNVMRFIGQMQSLPTYLTSQKGGEGFAEFARHLLSRRNS